MNDISAKLRRKTRLAFAAYCVLTMNLISVPLQAASSHLVVANNFDVQGHRGARAMRPENTLPAFLYALEVGVTTIELDIGVSADGHLVVLHDQVINLDHCQSTLISESQAKTWVHELTLEQIKSFDCGAKRNTSFPNQTPIPQTFIPTLPEVFQAVATSRFGNRGTVLFNIETKSDPANPVAQPEPKEFIKALLSVVNEFGVADRVTIQSFDHRTLIEAFQQAPNVQRAALFRDKPSDWIKAATAAHANIISPRADLISATSVAAMQAGGFKVIPWTANTPTQWRALMLMGVDGIITDDPEPLLKLIGRRQNSR